MDSYFYLFKFTLANFVHMMVAFTNLVLFNVDLYFTVILRQQRLS
jgi:hypothetical protein